MPAARTLFGLALAVLIAFFVARAAPGDAAATALHAQGVVPTAEAVAAFREAHGLDAPAWRQFIAWALGVVSGDWGRSTRTGESILAGLVARLPVSMIIGLGGLTLGAILASVLAFSAAAGSRLADLATRVLAIIAQALPAFCFGALVILVMGVQLRWIRPFTGGFLERTVPPILIIALYAAGPLARIIRRELLAAMRAPHFVTARSKGLSLESAIARHAGPFGLLALLAAIRARAAWVIGGAAVLEVLFAAPGISAWVVESIAFRDHNVLQGYILVVAVWMSLVHVGLDAAVHRVDPRQAR